ncbi:MAG: type II toxin-antitoxin system Phd/YefM family antitoxin [Acetobacteraceae bacterium]
MSRYGVAAAKSGLSKLIDRALAGEPVVITRHGHPVVELRPAAAPARPVAKADLDWLAVRRVGRRKVSQDAARLVSAMRDEDSG